ncbi:MAG TPA: hypothetical protein DEF18_02040 [Muricauda sp.]|uniref:Uncharacterized protein n=6 Tax=Flagellimonas TaxID=444459 RepID=A0A4S8RZ94_9FLAO|nr:MULTISPECIES: hypothetical protein [Allomuricauda]MAO17987.1 hypothetical protein [Allomuricauda sp.]KAB5483991.1 hypothetical protein FOT42_017330 [Allomuricauda hadalis]MBO0355823.1 hypothetical protein [Allomuricauda aurea]NDV45216.1 hypothetical protein [Allomuricauda sediminis]RIV42549.1 hypothetical protein D2V05_16300 [Allomuricauda maritima]|tara:strand:+ start:25054 stop:25500 length:447 start_codon:yes stop_codon:yes gene_type:complete
MKIKVYKTGIMVLATLLISACSQKQGSSVKDMLEDHSQQEEVLSALVENHDLGKKYIANMMDNDHAMGMMVDELVKAAAKDTILANKLSDMITRYPDLMLLTTHHFMPVIASDSLLTDSFCDHTLEHEDLAKAMHNKMEYKKSLERNH